MGWTKGTPARSLLLALMLVLLLPASPLAQVPERHISERPEPVPVEIAPPLIDSSIADDEPIGVDLKALVFLGLDEPVLDAAAVTVDVRVARLDDPAFRALVANYLSQPLSRRLIAEIEAAVIEFYRDQGFPFVAVSTPPQEISAGLLQFRVVEFRAGRIAVTTDRRATPEFVLSRIRLAPGEEIDSRLLSEDLSWLNRNPFRTLEAVFAPGAVPGETDLDLRVSEIKPWEVVAGYTNTGSKATGRDRFFLGASVADFPALDVLASYQFTASRDFWYDDGAPFGRARDPRFASHGGFMSIPVAPRQELEIIASHLRTFETGEFFDVRKQTTEGRVGHRSALSNVSDLPGDVIYGIEVRHQHRDTLFDGVTIATDEIDIFQGFAGWAHRWSHAWGATALDVRGHFSPGNLWAGNRDADFAAMSAGRVTRARYGYGSAHLEHLHRLPHEFSLAMVAHGRVASGPLPETEQFNIGGAHAVRGYDSDDGGYDWGGFLRNELRLPVMAVPLGAAGPPASLQPFAFLDAGHGANRSGGDRVTAVSIGGGLDVAVGRKFFGGLAVAGALRDGVHTRRGDVNVHARATLRY
jgi:hemolysin activation/secretion protein